MNTPLFYLKPVAIILSFIMISSCGMTPAEKKALALQNQEIRNNVLNAQQLTEAKKLFSQSKQVEWKNDSSFKFKNLEKGAGVWWQSKTQLMPVKGATKYCENLTINEYSIPATNFRLPSSEELKTACKSENILRNNRTYMQYIAAENRDHTTTVAGKPWRTTRHHAALALEELYWAKTNRCGIIKLDNHRIDYVTSRDENYVKCASNDPFEQHVSVIAMILAKNKSKKIHKLTLPSKPIFKSTAEKETIAKKEFETSVQFIARKKKNNKKYELAREREDLLFQQEVVEWEKHVKKLKNRHQQKLGSTNKNELNWSSYREALYIKYGAPQISRATYNADKQEFNITVGSERGLFNKNVTIPLAIQYAPKFKKLITAKSFSPTVELDIRNGEVFVTGIKEIADPALVVERDEYNKAKRSITKLETFIKKYPNSKYVVVAKKQIGKLENIAEQKRLAAIELKKDNAEGEILGSLHLEGAKFVAGRIWQDQAVNKRFNIRYKDAREYCEQLELLDNDGWRLPSKEDYLKLGDAFGKFSFVANYPGHVTPYFTRDENCSTSGGFFPIAKGNCVVTAYPKISKAKKNTSENSFRCVLSAYKYNKNAKTKESSSAGKNTIDGYIEAFSAAGNQEYIKKAYSLARNDNDRAKVEFALIKYFGFNDVFSLKGSLKTKEGTQSNRGDIDASLLLQMMTTSGAAEFDYNLTPNENSTVPLRFGKYKARIKIKISLEYKTTIEKLLFGLDMSDFNVEVKERIFDVILTPANGWMATGETDFGTIMQGSKGDVFILKTNTKLVDVTPSFDLISIERL